MIKRVVFAYSALFLFFISSGLLTAEDTATYIDDIKPVLQEKGCIGCHSYMNTYSDFISQVSSSTQAGIPIVNIASPDSSVILWRLKGEKPDGASIIRMPQGGDALPAATIALIKTWIEQGAPEDTPVDVKEIKAWSEIKKKFKTE